MDAVTSEDIIAALNRDKTIDIVTTGAKSGLARRTEIWFTKIGDRIIICGTPASEGGDGPRKRRDWLANMKATDKLQCQGQGRKQG